jgi:hypothetical protein
VNPAFIFENWNWMRGHAPYLVDCATVLLAVVGVVVSLIPVDKFARPYRVIYQIGTFVVLAVLAATVVIANTWQRENEESKQNIAARRFSDDLKSVKSSSDVILDIVAHPPKSVTKTDISNLAKVLIESQQKESRSDIPDDTLLKMADGVRTRMAAKSMEYVSRSEAAYSRFMTAAVMQPNPEPYEIRRKMLESANQQIGVDLTSDHIIEEATAIRNLMLKRFGDTTDTQTLGEFILRMKAISGSGSGGS